MALADPQALPGTPVINLAAIGSTVGNYQSDDSAYNLTVTHTRSGTTATSRVRHQPKLFLRKISADPMTLTQNKEYSMSVHLVIDAPVQGFTNVEQLALFDRFVDYVKTAGLGAKLIQGQA